VSAMSGSIGVAMSSEYDKRALSHMAADIRAVHYRLVEWATWSKDEIPNDWPKQTLLGRYVEQGDAIFSRSAKTHEMPIQVAETERAVLHLTGLDRKVIERYYRHWEPKEVRARKLGITVKRFDSLLNRARWRISGFLCAGRI
jgi:DNA-directed RNA polymerase specialized sigma24 family protein